MRLAGAAARCGVDLRQRLRDSMLASDDPLGSERGESLGRRWIDSLDRTCGTGRARAGVWHMCLAITGGHLGRDRLEGDGWLGSV